MDPQKIEATTSKKSKQRYHTKYFVAKPWLYTVIGSEDKLNLLGFH